jgi:hypothetical protein
MQLWCRTQRYSEKSKINHAGDEKKERGHGLLQRPPHAWGLKDGAGERKETRQEVQPRDQRGRSVHVCVTQSARTAQLFIAVSTAQS